MKSLLKFLYILSHPLMILPIAVLIIWRFGSYTPQQITELQQVPLFLQGSSDWGGSNIFSATIALYLVFGILGSIYLTLSLQKIPANPSFFEDMLSAIWIMRFHLWCFLLGSVFPFAENDFRNMCLFVTILYSATFVLIVVMNRVKLSLVFTLLFAQIFMLAWMIVGSDGNTAKAGQIVQAWQEPQYVARSARHAVMLSWHEFANRLFGEVNSDTWTKWYWGEVIFFSTLIAFALFYLLRLFIQYFKRRKIA